MKNKYISDTVQWTIYLKKKALQLYVKDIICLRLTFSIHVQVKKPPQKYRIQEGSNQLQTLIQIPLFMIQSIPHGPNQVLSWFSSLISFSLILWQYNSLWTPYYSNLWKGSQASSRNQHWNVLQLHLTAFHKMILKHFTKCNTQKVTVTKLMGSLVSQALFP